jgi:hypothetical protein
MTRPLYLEIKDSADQGDLGRTFVSVMGWGAPSAVPVRTQAAGEFWNGRVIANLKGFSVLLIDTDEMPETSVQRDVDKELFKQFAERITIFKSPSKTSWLWPRKRASGFLAAEKFEYATGTMPDYLAQKLAAISFKVSDHSRGITLGEVRDKVRGQFDTSAVTKKFYDDFKKQHESLTKQIVGLPESDAHSYSSLMLNRLMFIYFLQKKEFINGDPNYLRNCLDKVQRLNTDVKFYSFYKDLLKSLFFDGLNQQPHNFSNPKIAEILGDPPYINGGIFGANELEQQYADDIDIPDQAFEDIFNLFDSYRWHLDTSPTGNQNEINPEVIGYIFEQYINYTANGKRDKGAYYTPQDVCAFMAKSTIVPFLIEKLQNLGAKPEALLKISPQEFLNTEILHGWSHEKESWLDIPDVLQSTWHQSPSSWSTLDKAESDDSLCLPGESWVEVFHRRELATDLLVRLRDQEIGRSPSDYVTYPLNGILLLSEYLSQHASQDELTAFWIELSEVSIIDPTCGSGAFLFAAMEVLEDVYFALLDGMARLGLNQNSNTLLSLEKFGPVSLNLKYAVRKKIAIRNLYGTDLMPEAIETAKLRLFLSLAACLETAEDIEPLPDLDFNFKVANLVVGFYDQKDSWRISQDLFIQDSLLSLDKEIQVFKELHRSFVSNTASQHPDNFHELKRELQSASKRLREICDALYLESIGIEKSASQNWIAVNVPFHWFIEFPEIVEKGGFDIVLGNPPYIKKSDMSTQARATIQGYKTDDCPDFYSICYERSIQLLHPQGRHCMIVMISLSCGSKFASLRSVIDGHNGSEWWSTYGSRPDSLFNGIDVRNTILNLAPGSQKFSSAHRLYNKVTRAYLFNALEYAAIDRSGGDIPNRGGIGSGLVSFVNSSVRPVKQLSSDKLFTMKSIGYWYPVLPYPTPKLDEHLNPIQERHDRLIPIHLQEGEERDLAISLLAGKASFFWWLSTSNNMDNTATYASEMLPLIAKIEASPLLLSASKKVLTDSEDNYFALKYQQKHTVNVRWINCRESTDAFEEELFRLLGLEGEWRNLNIWYRQTLYCVSDDSGGKHLSWDNASKLIDWYKLNFSS